MNEKPALQNDDIRSHRVMSQVHSSVIFFFLCFSNDDLVVSFELNDISAQFFVDSTMVGIVAWRMHG